MQRREKPKRELYHQNANFFELFTTLTLLMVDEVLSCT
jgi:hypothetical protein